MKKQNKIIIGVIFGVAVAILLISFLFPSVYKGLTSGSFGKADKYRQEQMTEKDIQLRNDLSKDTAQLRQMVTGLIYFSLFTDNLYMTIDTCIAKLVDNGFESDPATRQVVAQLGNYNMFLQNNNKTLARTISMLSGLMLRDTIDNSQDYEKNIRDFATFVNQLNQKDSVLMQSITKVDKFIISNKTLQKKAEEIKNLKAIRDQLVIKSAQFMAITGNKPGVGAMINYALQSQSMYSGIGALNLIVGGSSVKLGSLPEPQARELASSSGALSAAFNVTELESTMAGARVNSKSDLGSLILYDKASLSFMVCNADQLKVLYGADKMSAVFQGVDKNLGCLGVSYGGNLGVVLNAGVLCGVLSSTSLNSVMSADRLGIIVPARELSAANSSLSNAGGYNASLQMGLCGSPTLQGVVSSNASLQRILSNEGAVSGFENIRSTSLGFVDIVE